MQTAFRKYSHDGNRINKLNFKCAFIYLTGMKPSKQDMHVIASYIGGDSFIMGWADFEKIMTLYMD